MKKERKIESIGKLNRTGGGDGMEKNGERSGRKREMEERKRESGKRRGGSVRKKHLHSRAVMGEQRNLCVCFG